MDCYGVAMIDVTKAAAWGRNALLTFMIITVDFRRHSVTIDTRYCTQHPVSHSEFFIVPGEENAIAFGEASWPISVSTSSSGTAPSSSLWLAVSLD